MAFYDPIRFDIDDLPVITYIDEGTEEVLPRFLGTVESTLGKLYHSNRLYPPDSVDEYHIDVLWKDGSDLMADVWMFSEVDTWGSGPLADVRVFRSGAPEEGIAVGSGNTLMLLGREEEHRRSLDSLEKFLVQRPTLPEVLTLGRSFV